MMQTRPTPIVVVNASPNNRVDRHAVRATPAAPPDPVCHAQAHTALEHSRQEEKRADVSEDDDDVERGRRGRPLQRQRCRYFAEDRAGQI